MNGKSRSHVNDIVLHKKRDTLYMCFQFVRKNSVVERIFIHDIDLISLVSFHVLCMCWVFCLILFRVYLLLFCMYWCCLLFMYCVCFINSLSMNVLLSAAFGINVSPNTRQLAIRVRGGRGVGRWVGR